MPVEEHQIQKLKDSIRTKPGMYFGWGGCRSIPAMLRYLLEGILEEIPQTRPIKVEVVYGSESITVHFADWACSLFPVASLEEWLNQLLSHNKPSIHYITFVAFASDSFTVESCDGVQLARLSLRDNAPLETERQSCREAPFLRIVFHPVERVFQRASEDELYQIAGSLRVLSLLRAGLATSLRADSLPHEMAYYYQNGCKSLLFEEDYERWPLHPGCLSFGATNETMSVEGHLRFLHAGVPWVKTFVNYHPTQGGTDLEGLGQALRDLFPDCGKGCRVLTLVTNPDTGAKIRVPHSFIGVMHLQTTRPSYAGPTRDVLCDPEARAFVHQAASVPLREQWAALQKG